VGFTGGKKSGPSYYSLGDHTETVEIQYDPKKATYRDMLKIFWENHDSTACHSRQYMSAIFYHDSEQERIAKETKEEHQKKVSRTIQTKIAKAETFYDAEDYHQKYLLRQRRHILDELNLSEDEIKKSHVCTRLNGYCGGYASVADLDKEIDGFGLSEEGKTRLRDLVKRGKHH
jgi:peptide-methionine (S)-S-oxide reductase